MPDMVANTSNDFVALRESRNTDAHRFGHNKPINMSHKAKLSIPGTEPRNNRKIVVSAMIDSARRNLMANFDPVQLSPPFTFE